MTKRHLPSIEALCGNDDDLLSAELRLCQVHEQLALARTLIEKVDHDLGMSGGRQIVAVELVRLGCRIVAIARALATQRIAFSTG